MNIIEEKFYEAYKNQPVNNLPYTDFELIPQFRIGIYVVDFVYGGCAIEIDGHEYHKTKEQREKDYSRERYLMKKGYQIIRFMGTEVFLDAESCVLEMIEIVRSKWLLMDYLKDSKKVM